MIQFNLPWRPHEYWKRKAPYQTVKEMKSMLEKRGYHTGSIKDTRRLQECLKRSDLGLLSYVKYTNDELRDFIRARQIDTSHIAGKGHRSDLVAVLEREDFNPKFGGFTRLPAELRNRIYEYHFIDFAGTPLHAPKQPPITLVSSLLRTETLPLFYASCTFDFNLLLPDRSRGQSNLRLPDETTLWLHSLAEENMANIRHIRVMVSFRIHDWYRRQTRFMPSLEIHLDHYHALEGVLIHLSYLTNTPQTELTSERMKNNVLRAFQQAATRRGGWKLEKEDFFAVRRAIEDSGRQ